MIPFRHDGLSVARYIGILHLSPSEISLPEASKVDILYRPLVLRLLATTRLSSPRTHDISRSASLCCQFHSLVVAFAHMSAVHTFSCFSAPHGSRMTVVSSSHTLRLSEARRVVTDLGIPRYHSSFKIECDVIVPFFGP